MKFSTLSSLETPVGLGVRFSNGKFWPIACVMPLSITGVTFSCIRLHRVTPPIHSHMHMEIKSNASF